jgi:integrase
MARATLTDVMVRRIRPPARGQVEHWDVVIPGFALRVSDSGRKSWVLMARLRGELLRYTIGTYPTIGLAKARELARSALHLIAEGKDPRDERKRRVEQRTGTFASVAAAFVAGDRNAGPGWAAERARVLRRELLPAWGPRPIASITRRDVIALLDGIVARDAPVQANRTLAVISRLFSWAVNHDLAPGSPCVRLEKPGGRERKRERVLADTEVRALWRAWDARGGIFATYCKVLLLTVQRRGEVAAMRWADLDLEGGLWTIARSKGGHAHEVPLTPGAVGLLRTIPQQGDCAYVFSTRRARPVSGFGKLKETTAKTSGVTGWRLHDLRRTAATNMAALGISKETIKRVLGHAESDITATYVRFGWIAEKRAALEAWAAHVARIIAEADQRGAA